MKAKLILLSNIRDGSVKNVVTSIDGPEIEVDVFAPWQSKHLCVYDIDNLIMRIVVQEN